MLPRQLRCTRGAVIHQKKNFLVVRAIVSLLSASFCRPAGGPGAWCRCPVFLSGLVVWPCRLVSSSGPVFSFFLKRGDDPGHRPKDRSSVRYPFYARHDSGIGRGCCVLTFVFISSFCRLPHLRSSVQTHRWGPEEEPPRVERALRGGCSSFLSFLVVLTLLVTGCVCRRVL